MSSPRLASDAAVRAEIHKLRKDVDGMQSDIANIKTSLVQGGVRFDTLEQKLDEGNAATKDLVDAWRAASGTVRFVKWLSGLGTAVLALWGAVQLFWKAP